MKEDPIVEEIRQHRAAHASRYDNDLDKIFAALKTNEIKFYRQLKNPGPKKLLPRTGS